MTWDRNSVAGASPEERILELERERDELQLLYDEMAEKHDWWIHGGECRCAAHSAWRDRLARQQLSIPQK